MNFKIYAKRLSLLLLIPLFNIFYIILNNWTGYAHNIAIGVDEVIPYMAIFIIPYVIWYPYLGLGLTYFAIRDKDSYYKSLFSILLNMIICYIVYLLFQTTVIRPEIINTDIFNNLVSIIYGNDKPFNCFPSLHVTNTMAILIPILVSNTKKSYKLLNVLLSVLIILSTLFIKQHVVLDVIAGIVLSIISYYIVHRIYHFVKNKKRAI